MRWSLWALVLTVLSGCHAFQMDVDGQIDERATQPVDMPPASSAGSVEDVLGGAARPMFGSPLAARDASEVAARNDGQPPDKGKKPNPEMMDRLRFNKDILGFDVPDLKMPGRDAKDPEWDAAIKKQFKALPPLPKLAEGRMGAGGLPLALADLQQIALRTNPTIRQAHLQVEAARGQALQAGLYPNPNIGYEAGSIGQGDLNGQRSPGQQGGFYEQTIVTMGKLTLARNAALRDVQIAELTLRRTESDVQTQVRSGYFAVLAARENYRMTKGLTELTDELYHVLLGQLKAGLVAPYEPMQIRVLSLQSRQTLVQAHNRYVSAWRQLAASLGTPDAPLTELSGKIDMSVPHFEFDQLKAYVLANHTDVIAAQFAVDKHRHLVRLAEVQPYPDVTVHTAFQKDYTTPPFGTVANVTVGLPFPLFNRNQGNIQSARALLRKALDDNARVQNDLSTRTADAFERYDNNRTLLQSYKDEIMPGQVQAFRAALARHAFVGDQTVSYNDVVTSQQTLVSLINTYLGSLSDQWTAVTDIANLLQTNDLFQAQVWDEVAPIPDVPQIMRGGLHPRR